MLGTGNVTVNFKNPCSQEAYVEETMYKYILKIYGRQMVLSTLEVKQQERRLIWGRKAVLNKMVNEGHTKKIAFEKKPEGT